MKKIIYLICSVFLGILLGTIVHGVAEIEYLKYPYLQNIVPEAHPFWGTNCFLPAFWQYLFLAGGAIGGYFVGKRWWQIVYVEHRHWRNKLK